MIESDCKSQLRGYRILVIAILFLLKIVQYVVISRNWRLAELSKKGARRYGDLRGGSKAFGGPRSHRLVGLEEGHCILLLCMLLNCVSFNLRSKKSSTAVFVLIKSIHLKLKLDQIIVASFSRF